MENGNQIECKVYRRRYVMLAVYSLMFVLTFFHLQSNSAIADVLIKFYSESYETVNLLGIITNINCVLFFYPVGKFVQKYGLRTSMLSAALITAIGAIIKCLSIKRSLFSVLAIGHAFIAFTPSLFTACMTLLAAVWFKTSEASTVFGIANAAFSVGFIIAFFLPSIVSTTTENDDDTKRTLFWITAIPAACSVLFFILILIVFKEKPEKPPSLAEHRKTKSEKKLPLKTLLTNKNAIIICICSCLTNTLLQVSYITLNQSVMTLFNDSNTLTIAGTLFSVFGIPGAILTGMQLKKYPKYFINQIIFSVSLAVSASLYILSLYILNSYLLYISMALIGYLTMAMAVQITDYLIEVSYPFPESVTMVFMNATATMSGIVFVPLITFLITNYGAVKANLILLPISILNIVLSLFIKEDLRRREANQ